MANNKRITVLVLAIFLMGCKAGFAQVTKPAYKPLITKPVVEKDSIAKDTAKADTADDDVREFIPSLAYGSNYVPTGRASAKPEPYIDPSFTYNAKSGFTTGFDAYKLIDLPKDINELDLNIGWDFDYWDKFQASLSYMRMIFPKYAKPTPYEETLAMYQNNIDVFAAYDLKYVTAGLRFDYFNGMQRIPGPKGKTVNADTSNDYFVSFEMYHDFEFDNLFQTKGDLVIEPYFTLMGGTRTFYGQRVTQKRNRVIKTGSSGSSAFDLADIEIDVPFKYTYHKFTFAPEVDYVYLFPSSQNPTNQSEEANTPIKTPAAGFLVYILTVSFKFTSKK